MTDLLAKWRGHFNKDDETESQPTPKKENPNAKLFISCGGFIE